MDGFYPGDSADTSPSGSNSNPTPAPDKSEDDSAETFLTPKSAFGDVKVGDQQTVEAVHIYEDEIEWKPVGKESETPAETKSIGEEIDSMAT